MWAQFRKYAPFAAIVGYLLVYMNKGWDKIITDLSGMTVDKITAKWQEILMVAVAVAIIYVIGRLKLPAPMKALIVGFAYLFIGYNLAKVIDPPNGATGATGVWMAYKRNGYAYGVK